MSYSRTQKYRTLKRCRSSDSSEGDITSESAADVDSSTSTINTSRNVHADNAIGMESKSITPDVTVPGASQKADNVREIHQLVDETEKSHLEIHLSEASSSDSEYYSDDDEESSDTSFPSAVEPVELLGSPEQRKNLREELRDCALKHVNHITHSFLNDLLGILRSAGHTELPKTAETLLRTQRTGNRIRPMRSKKGTCGTYMYLGIERQLQLMISNCEFECKEVNVLVNVDGLLIFARSKQQLWPILMQVSHKEYFCKPFVVALYCGDSKPYNANIFMEDFIQECSGLIENGFVVKNSLRFLKIIAFVCDTPARSFIKCCKGHTAFYGCERCTIRGITVNKRRVYPKMNCRLPTKNSFAEKRQPEHHTGDLMSPLVQIPQFDAVNRVVLDYMHLLCCGVMKSLIEKWFSSSRENGKIGQRERYNLSELLSSLSSQIPVEFQRKQFDITDRANWKATQYRYFLLYAGGLILRPILSLGKYRHFLLLFVACRILCSSSWVLLYTDQAELFLRDFFKNMPKHYGKDSRVMNFHNLVHLADDVRSLQAPLTDYSSFPFENCLGKIKKLVRTPRNPVAQVFRRLSENDSVSRAIQKYDSSVINRKLLISINEHVEGPRIIEYKTVNSQLMTIGIVPPNNIVRLRNGNIFKITRIYSIADNLDRVLIQGYSIYNLGDAFRKPMPSSQIGIFEIRFIALGNRKTTTIDQIMEKCLLLHVSQRTYAVTLLHSAH